MSKHMDGLSREEIPQKYETTISQEMHIIAKSTVFTYRFAKAYQPVNHPVLAVVWERGTGTS